MAYINILLSDKSEDDLGKVRARMPEFKEANKNKTQVIEFALKVTKMLLENADEETIKNIIS